MTTEKIISWVPAPSDMPSTYTSRIGTYRKIGPIVPVKIIIQATELG